MPDYEHDVETRRELDTITVGVVVLVFGDGTTVAQYQPTMLHAKKWIMAHFEAAKETSIVSMVAREALTCLN